MKKNSLTFFVLASIFLVMIVLLAVQSTQESTLTPSTNETLRENAIQLEYGVLFPELSADDVVLVNILDPVRQSQVTIARSPANLWQVVAEENRATNQDYASSLAMTLEKMPYTARIGIAEPAEYQSYGLNEQDGLIVVSAVLRDESLHSFLVGNPVSTDNRTRGFYAVVDEQDAVYIIPPEPIMYLVQYLEAYENSEKLDN